MADQKGQKVIITFKSTPGTPALEKNKCGFFTSFTVQKVLAHLRKTLGISNETPLVKIKRNEIK